jgi:hypothetical protein
VARLGLDGLSRSLARISDESRATRCSLADEREFGTLLLIRVLDANGADWDSHCPSQETLVFQSTNTPLGLSRQAHTWSS